ncbi:MAG: cation-translocating P-type ATPase [Oscillospiraceae bacterium]|nr:cation-translocating P-type ATPase [Oscillospiraceae bacterium]
MQHHLEALQDVFREVKSGPSGLSAAEANARLERDGKNKLREAEKESLIKRFFQQMMDPMIIILLVAAAISAVLTIYEGRATGHTEFPSDVVIILTVVIINAIMGLYQESKAEAALEALQAMTAATSKVLRDGKVTGVKSEDLAVGDVILLEAGDAVPADARLFECVSLQIEEAALTGESVPVSKRTDKLREKEVTLGDRKNMVYMGSAVAFGRGRAVVTATGMATEMGHIAEALEQAEEGLTPLQIKLKQLSKILTWLVLGVCVFIFGFSAARELLWGDGRLNFSDMLNFFMIAVSLAVAAIPEGLVAVVTITLSIGVTNLSKKRAIIRKLTAVETLGCAQIICSDKTGTLTQNKMTVTESAGPDLPLLARAMALCCDAAFLPEGGTMGEPTEVALINYAKALGLDKGGLEAEMPRAGEAPFDSSRKMMSTVHKTGEKFIQYTKGAPDEVLKVCTSVLTDQGVMPMTQEKLDEILAENARMAGQALRVLAAASREYAAMPESCEPADLERGLCFLGLCGMIDPVRPEVRAAIEQCGQAGVTAVMITGDHRDTAVAIANELGILDDGRKAITGMELSRLSDKEFEETVHEYAVYARVQPEHKVRIVNAWRARGCVTAMTGDGVNDAPSIKSADIGVGMGITGTDVTKNVADMVLSDDNFATIVTAVGEGRRIYANIRKAIQFLLGSNISEVMSIFIASVLGITILKPAHLLYVNLVTDCFPALALGMEKPDPDVMRQKPRHVRDGVFAGGLGTDCLYQGAIVTVLIMAAFFIGEFLQNGHWQFTNILEADGAEGMTMAFLTMNMAEMFHSFNMRSQRGSIFTMSRKSGTNWWLWGSFVISLFLSCVVILVPALREAFKLTPITTTEFGIAMGLAFSIIPAVEIVKFFQKKFGKKN